MQPQDKDGRRLINGDIVRWPNGKFEKVWGQEWENCDLGWVLFLDGIWKIKIASYKNPDQYITLESVQNTVMFVGHAKDVVIG